MPKKKKNTFTVNTLTIKILQFSHLIIINQIRFFRPFYDHIRNEIGFLMFGLTVLRAPPYEESWVTGPNLSFFYICRIGREKMNFRRWMTKTVD